MTTVPKMIALFTARGSNVVYRKVGSITPCPCRTPEGYRDMTWHKQHPTAPMCNENAMLPDPANTVNVLVKAFVQPIQSTRATRLTDEAIRSMFGDVQADDHLGIFPITWVGVTLDFYGWSRAGEDYINYDDRRFTVVNANKIPDPSDGNPDHHWEVGLRLVSDKPVE